MGLVPCRLSAERTILIAAADPPRHNRTDLYPITKKLLPYLIRPIQQVIAITLAFGKQTLNLRPIKLTAR